MPSKVSDLLYINKGFEQNKALFCTLALLGAQTSKMKDATMSEILAHDWIITDMSSAYSESRTGYDSP